MIKKSAGYAIAAAMLLGLAGPGAAEWKPAEPVTIIVPWSPGGSTDSVTRVLAGDLEKALGQTVVVVNQPGAAGSVGTTNAWKADHDGLTWAAGAAVDLGSYPVLGMLDVPIQDWRLYLHIANVVKRHLLLRVKATPSVTRTARFGGRTPPKSRRQNFARSGALFCQKFFEVAQPI